MQLIRSIFIILFSALFGFGVWYLVLWFLTNQPDPLQWSILTKIIYLFLGWAAMIGVAQAIEE